MADRATDLYERLSLRSKATLIAVAVALFVILILSLMLPYNSEGAELLLDHHKGSVFPYPFTIQNATYIILAVSLADLYCRWLVAKREHEFLKRKFLPEDRHTVLQLGDLGSIRDKVGDLYDDEDGFLPYLIDVTIIQLQASRSVDQAVAILTSTLDLMTHRVDLRYQMVRYVTWLIPTIGFIGTVIGIAAALAFINPDNIDVGRVTSGLGVSFHTTLVALIVSVILVYFQSAVQKQEEGALNAAGQYCLKNLINRIHIEPVEA